MVDKRIECAYRNLLAGLALKVRVALLPVLQVHQTHDRVDLYNDVSYRSEYRNPHLLLPDETVELENRLLHGRLKRGVR